MKGLSLIASFIWGLTGIVWAAFVLVTLAVIFIGEIVFLKELYSHYGEGSLWKKGQQPEPEKTKVTRKARTKEEAERYIKKVELTEV